MKLIYFLLLGLILVSGCNESESLKNESVYTKHENFARFELPQVAGECRSDSQCIIGGCNGETCTAKEAKVTTCDVPKGMKSGVSCKCINQGCIWTKK